MISTVLPLVALILASTGDVDAPPQPRPPRPGVQHFHARPVQVHRVEGAWQPGGYEGRIGSPYYYSVAAYAVPIAGHGVAHHGSHRGCGCTGWHSSGYTHGWGHFGAYYAGWQGYDPYSYHFGPGYYRHAEHGHFRFPYYSYRRPWYHPGPPVFNRDTNFAW